MSTNFTVRVEDKDWNSVIGGWYCSALSIPGAAVGKVYANGGVVDSANYQVDLPNRMIRWPSNPHPETLAIEIVLEKGLTTSWASAWIAAVASIVTALISAAATYYSAVLKVPGASGHSQPISPPITEIPPPVAVAQKENFATPNEGEVPEGRTLVTAPFQVHLEDCAKSSCDVTLFLRGRDPRGRIRYQARESFLRWSLDEWRETTFNVPDKLYFRGNEQVRYELWCQLDNGAVISGESKSLTWSARNEVETGVVHSVWLKCGNSEFSAEVGISVRMAAKGRKDEPDVMADAGPPH